MPSKLARALPLLGALALCRCSCPSAHGPCAAAADCITEEVCVEQRCRSTCNSNQECPLAESCRQGACLPNLRDSGNTDAMIGPDTGPRDRPSQDAPAADRLATDRALQDAGPTDLGPADAPTDAATTDALRFDAARSDAASTDVGVVDRAALDRFAPDRAADARVLDVGAPDAALPGCAAQYGMAPEFLLCHEQANACLFGTRVAGETCRHLCADLGGQCLAAYDDGNASVNCNMLFVAHCDEIGFASIVCACTRGAAMPDGGSWDAPLSGCIELFGGVPEFQLCADPPASCTFFTRAPSSETCANLCAATGQTCSIAAAATPDAGCQPAGEVGCLASTPDLICSCTR